MNPDWIDQQKDPFEVEPQEVFKHFGRSFYDGSLKYWSEQPATVGGMLKALESLSDVDLAFTRRVITLHVEDHQIPTGSCVDVACGIGRVAANVLSDFYKRIDLVDPIERFVKLAETELTGIGIEHDRFIVSAQDWTPQRNYDAFWCQWTAMWLTDDDFVAFLKRCKTRLNKGGVVFVKDNVVFSGNKSHGIFAPDDHSTARTIRHFRELFVEAGFSVDFAQEQPKWPAEYIPMWLFVLTPD
jgi:protein N-terminal methyltransferase